MTHKLPRKVSQEMLPKFRDFAITCDELDKATHAAVRVWEDRHPVIYFTPAEGAQSRGRRSCLITCRWRPAMLSVRSSGSAPRENLLLPGVDMSEGDCSCPPLLTRRPSFSNWSSVSCCWTRWCRTRRWRWS